MGVIMIDNKDIPFAMLIGRATQFEASSSTNSTDSLCLQVAQVPRYQDLAIFSWTTMTTKTIELIALPLVHSTG